MAKNQRKNNKPVIPRPLWYVFLFAGIVSLVCALFLIIRWSLNAYYVAEAKKGKYHYGLEKSLTTLNFPDGYVVWYNLGNYYYMKEDFKEAEDDYYRTIERGIPYLKECPVKVNLALAMIGQLTDEEWDAFFDDSSEEMSAEARNVEKSLITARTILIEDGCAHEDDEDGHDEQAQILKDEIDELLQNGSDDNEDEEDDDTGGSGDEDENEDNSSGDGGGQNNSSREDQVMDHIQDGKEEAQAERAEDQQFYENYYGFGDDPSEGSGSQGGGEDGGSGSSGENGEIW